MPSVMQARRSSIGNSSGFSDSRRPPKRGACGPVSQFRLRMPARNTCRRIEASGRAIIRAKVNRAAPQMSHMSTRRGDRRSGYTRAGYVRETIARDLMRAASSRHLTRARAVCVDAIVDSMLFICAKIGLICTRLDLTSLTRRALRAHGHRSHTKPKTDDPTQRSDRHTQAPPSAWRRSRLDERGAWRRSLARRAVHEQHRPCAGQQ